ncbi:MAG: ferrous iron transport protein B [Opitutales bacterium]
MTAHNIVLIGNPNTGKSSLFNALTGAKQRVGNYPGVTVEKKSGIWHLDQDHTVQLFDLPGTYSLSAQSPDERIAVDVLTGQVEGLSVPDLIIAVVDVQNLQRNLFLASQVADLEIPMVIALNCWDQAEKKGLQIDCALLASRLGVPVIPTVAHRHHGMETLAAAVQTALRDRPMMTRPQWPTAVRAALDRLDQAFNQQRGEGLRTGVLQRLLFDRSSPFQERLQTASGESQSLLKEIRGELYRAGYNPDAAESLVRFRFLNPLLADIVARQTAIIPRSRSESIDQLLLHRFWGLVVFFGMMYLVFQSVYTWASPFMDLIEGLTGWLQSWIAPFLETMPMLQSLVIDGVIGGVGSFLIFLPQILVLFLFIALLEESGYMARAAFLMDKLFRWCGLSGKSFVPLLSSYACAIPGILSARTIADPKARLITVLLTPLMSCSARLPVYVLLIGAFIEPQYGPGIAGLTLFAMHVIGLCVAAPCAWLLHRFCLRGQPTPPYFMELPAYKPPNLRHMLGRVYASGRDFIVRAGTVIFAMTIVIWALLYFPRPPELAQQFEQDGSAVAADPFVMMEPLQAESERLHARDAAYLEQSYLGRMGKWLQPIFAPAGYDWKITVGILASFPAREIIVSTLGIAYALGGDVDDQSRDLRSRLAAAKWESGPMAGQPIFTIAVVLSLMVFFALCMQCGATVATLAQELNWAWAIASFGCVSLIAWLAAVVTYQLSHWILCMP